MRKTLALLGGVILISWIPSLLTGCGCGFSCSGSNNDNDSASLTLGFSDSLPEDLKEVNIEVNSITFRRSGGNVVIDTFTIPALNVENAETFTLNLLDYRGVEQLNVITNREMPTGSYSALEIGIVSGREDSGAIENSSVLLSDDTLQPLIISNNRLDLEGLSLASGSQNFTVEFGLARALRLEGDSRYELTSTGVRVENNATAAELSGRVDRSLFNSEPPCDAKSVPEEGNRIYLYTGADLSSEQLVDVYIASESTEQPPAEAVAPFAVASLASGVSGWQYSFGFIPAGNYTMAFSCNTSADDSVQWDDLDIPLPNNQIYQIELSEGEEKFCDISVDGAC